MDPQPMASSQYNRIVECNPCRPPWRRSDAACDALHDYRKFLVTLVSRPKCTEGFSCHRYITKPVPVMDMVGYLDKSGLDGVAMAAWINQWCPSWQGRTNWEYQLPGVWSKCPEHFLFWMFVHISAWRPISGWLWPYLRTIGEPEPHLLDEPMTRFAYIVFTSALRVRVHEDRRLYNMTKLSLRHYNLDTDSLMEKARQVHKPPNI
jgi:hypothetical protein